MRYDTIKEAAQAWVDQFNAIPLGIAQKLEDELNEITPISRGDHVYIFNGEHAGREGDIIEKSEDDDNIYVINLNGADQVVTVDEGDFEVQRDEHLPMWGTLWAFGEPVDNWWLEEKGGLQVMADCGFRIYEQEDYEYVFGIDGMGYNFYDQHWIPLYKARGLQWHEEEVI